MTTTTFKPIAIPDTFSEAGTLGALNQSFIRAVRTSDVGWFDRNLDADFVNTNLDGSLMSREAYLEQVARPFALTGFDCNDVRVRVMGDFAIVHARTAYVKPDKSPGAGRYTDVWVRREAGWRCVAAHATRG
jgi:ketosteroid isomerase-like protein